MENDGKWGVGSQDGKPDGSSRLVQAVDHFCGNPWFVKGGSKTRSQGNTHMHGR